ncbi:polysaccharide deacetylase family protein [Spirillospora sp. NPDC046719]
MQGRHRPHGAPRPGRPLVLLSAALLAWAPGSPPANAQTRTWVSLTFDDGLQDQYDNVRTLLDRHGMKATFFVSTGLLGRPGRMTRSEVMDLAASGHEIGGHTLDHLDLTDLPGGERHRQVCDDRTALRRMGLPARAFAYPFGAVDDDAARTVRACGYRSARGVGGIRAGTSCPRCGSAETVPPEDPYRTRTRDSITAGTRLGDLEDSVVQAERHGGWLQLVFHHVCDGCGQRQAVTPRMLAAFLSWLRHRTARGTGTATVTEVAER